MSNQLVRSFIASLFIIPLVFFSGCGGGGSEPVIPNQGNNTPEIEAADQALTAAITRCDGTVQLVTVSVASGGQQSLPPSQPCFDDLIVALLLWKSAPKKDNSLAWWDPAYQRYVVSKIIYNVDRIGRSIPPQYQNTISDQFIAGYHGYFLPRASGALGPQQFAVFTANSPI